MRTLNDVHKLIYNLYLKAYRQNNNKPFRFKKKFDDVEKDEEILGYLYKLESVFKKYPAFLDINYFNAPYKIYKDEKKFFSLKFFSSHKGITTCIAYYKVLREQSPTEQLEYIKKSFEFICKFCHEKKLLLRQYVDHCSISQNDCLKHLKEHKISWYVVFSIPKFYELLMNLPKDEFYLYFGEDLDLIEIRRCYMNSPEGRRYCENIKNKISQFLEKSLASR